MKNRQDCGRKIFVCVTLVMFSVLFLSVARGNGGVAGDDGRRVGGGRGPGMGDEPKLVPIGNASISLLLDPVHRACIRSLVVNGKKVIDAEDGIFTSVRAGGIVYSSLHLRSEPVLRKEKNTVILDGIRYGDGDLTINEKWTFIPTAGSIKWDIERSCSRPLVADGA